MILSRTNEGRQRAKANGVKFGRKSSLSPHQRKLALQKLAEGEDTLREIAAVFNVSPMAIHRLKLKGITVVFEEISHKKVTATVMVRLHDAANQLTELRELLSVLGYDYEIEVHELTAEEGRHLFGDTANMKFSE